MHIAEYIVLNGYVAKDSMRIAMLIAIDKRYHLSIVEYLVEQAGTNICARNCSSHTPAQSAQSCKNREDIAAYLFQAQKQQEEEGSVQGQM
jgi:hypothetical protein